MGKVWVAEHRGLNSRVCVKVMAEEMAARPDGAERFGREAAAAAPHIEEIDISIPLGSELVPLPEGSRYLGFLFARSGTPEAVEEALRRAFSRLEFIIED